MPITIRPVRSDELEAWFTQLGATFLFWPMDPPAASKAPWIQEHLERRLAAFDGDAIVGTYRTFAAELTLPGGLPIPVGAVSAVSVRTTHRRRGILNRFIDRDTADSLDRGDVASILYAAEWPIYGRYGYGPASWQANWTIRARAAAITTEPVGSVSIVAPAEARSILPRIYDAHRPRQPGEITRRPIEWDIDLGLVDAPGRPKWQGAIAIHRDDEGEPDGYVRYKGEEHWEEGIPDNIVKVSELVGATPEAEIELWRFLFTIDLVATVQANGRRMNEPLRWVLRDARAAQVTRVNEGLWVRPFDVPRLLGERHYEGAGDLVLEVIDRLGDRPGPAAGRFRLEAGPDGARCTATRKSADLSLGASLLGAASLGGTRLVDAARAGGAVEHRHGALDAADRLLHARVEPWASTFF